MSTASDQVDWEVKIDEIVNATCPPWVKFAVGENYVAVRSEVSSEVMSTELIKSPLIIRGQIVLLLARGCVGIIVEWFGDKH